MKTEELTHQTSRGDASGLSQGPSRSPDGGDSGEEREMPAAPHPTSRKTLHPAEHLPRSVHRHDDEPTCNGLWGPSAIFEGGLGRGLEVQCQQVGARASCAGIHYCHCEPSVIEIIIITIIIANPEVFPYARHTSFSKYFAYIISFNPLRDPVGGPCYYNPH